MRLILSVILLASTALSQTAVYPGGVATDAQLIVAKDNIMTSLTASVNAVTTTLPVASVSGWVANMIATICDTSTGSTSAGTLKCTSWEDMLVTSVGASSLTVTRGFGGTSAASHSSGRLVAALVKAWAHNALKNEIIAIETALAAASPSSGSGLLLSSAFNWSQTPSGSISVGSNTVTLTPCPTGVAGANTNHWVYLSGPSAAATTAVSTATNTTASTPIRVNTGAAHNLTTGNIVRLSGMGNPQANGTFAVQSISSTAIDLLGSINRLSVARATNASPIVISISAGATPDHGIQTGDTVTIANVVGNTAANGTFTATRVNNYDFSLQGSTGNGAFVYSPSSTISGTYTSSSGIVTYGPEAVLITGGTCTSGAASGTITFAAANARGSGYTIQSATAGTAEAIAVATAAGTRGVQIAGGAQTWYAGITLPSNFELRGVSGSTAITLQAATPETPLIAAVGVVAGTTTSTATIAEATRATQVTSSFTVASTAGMAVGDLLMFHCNCTAGYFNQSGYIGFLSGSAVTMKAPVTIPLLTTDTNNVWRISPVTNVVIRDLILDGGTQGNNQYSGSLDMWGVYLKYVTNSLVENVRLSNWGRSAALYLSVGHGNRAHNIYSSRGGSALYLDVGFEAQTDLQTSNVESQDASGFGVGYFYNTNTQATNIRVNGPAARCLKIASSNFSEFTNIQLSQSWRANGLAISGGSYQLKINNVISNLNAYEGAYFFGEGNQYIVINGFSGYTNGWFAAAGEGGYSIIIASALDNHITIRDIHTDNYIVDYGTENSISTATVLRAGAYNSAVQSLTSGAGAAITFDTEAYDIGGLHSTVSDTSRFTLPIWAGGAPALSPFPATPGGTYTVCGQISFAANATGQRGVQLVKTSGVSVTTIAYSLINAAAAGVTNVPACGSVRLAGGDYVEMYGVQNSGGALNTVAGDGNTFLTITRAF